MFTEAETGMIQPKVKEHQQPPKGGGGKKDSSLVPPERWWLYKHLIPDFGAPELWENKFMSF